MLIDVVLCIKQCFGLRESGVDVDPAHGDGAGELGGGEAGVEEPVVYSVDGVGRGGEGGGDLGGGPVLAVGGGFGVGDGHDVLLDMC